MLEITECVEVEIDEDGKRIRRKLVVDGWSNFLTSTTK